MLVEQAPADTRVLDIGCGAGQVACHLADTGLEAVGIDLSQRNVDAALDRGVRAVIGDLMSMPFDTAGFDAAVAFNVLLHVPREDLPDALREVRRVLVGGAVFLWVVWGGHDHDGPADDEWLDPPRRFVNHTDEVFADLPTPGFERLDTRFLHEHRNEGGYHPQVAVLRAA